jgi:hypothetical protein
VSTSAGYSGVPLPRKLGIREGAKVALIRAPEGFDGLLSPLPGGVHLIRRLGRDADVIVAFVTERSRLEAELDRLRGGMHDGGGLWIAWPKRASGAPTDLTEDVVREIALATGLVDNKVCAIDSTWSGLRLVVRRRDRSGATPRR